MTLKTKTKLEQMYDSLNLKYWNNNLTKINIIVKEIKSTYGEYNCPDNKKQDILENYSITINARMHWRSKKSMRSTLLHEMCHHSVFLKNKQKYWDKKIIWHGKEWRKEMKRVGFKGKITKYT